MDFTSIFKGRFSSGRKAVRQTPCRIHSGRQSRPHFLAFWPHLLVFSRISVRRRQCVKHAYICGIGVSAIRKIPQNRRIFRLVAGVSRVSGIHKKINISATKGVVFVSGEPWVGSPWTPNVNYTKERIYRKTEKEQQRERPFFRCTANRFPSAPTKISRSGFLFLLFLCPKKDFVKDVFLIRLAKSRECRPSFRKKIW